MIVYIHSSGRVDRQITLPQIMTSGADYRLVVQAREAKAYAATWPGAHILTLPPRITMLSPTRQWLLENAESEKFVLMDDDLMFFERRKDDPEKFERTPRTVRAMLRALDKALDARVHVGIAAREGANRVTAPHVDCTRAMRVLGYRRDAVRQAGARFDRLPTKQDFDITLQLLRLGYPNRVIYDYVHNQPGSSTAGGCSAYRDEAMLADCAHRLATLHPGLVTVVTKPPAGSWPGERVDVRIAWKKAYEEGRRG